MYRSLEPGGKDSVSFSLVRLRSDGDYLYVQSQSLESFMLDLVHFTGNPSRLYMRYNYVIVMWLEPPGILGKIVRKTAGSEERTFS